MLTLACVVLAAAAPVVQGRVGEPAGAAAGGARVSLVQGERTQVIRTGPDGKFRFRAVQGPATVSVALPQGWWTARPSSQAFPEVLPGDVIRADFDASPVPDLATLKLVKVPQPEAGRPIAAASMAERGKPSRYDASA